MTPQASTADMVSQVLYEVPNFRTKINLIEHLVRKDEFQRVIIFARTKSTADNIFKFLARKVIEPAKIRIIHANKGQNTRINAMEAFREGNIKVLVSTDVAARGIDIIDVSHVINFDVPLIYEDYVHRIGRTGRANHTGEAITFMTMAEAYHVQKIERIIRMTIPREPIPRAVEQTETPPEEQQAMLREIDDQRRKEDPTFLGAFHEKKGRPVTAGKDRLKTKSRLTGAKKPASLAKSGPSAAVKTGGNKRSGTRGGRR